MKILFSYLYFLFLAGITCAQTIPGEYILDLEFLSDQQYTSLSLQDKDEALHIEMLSPESRIGFIKGEDVEVKAYLRKHNLLHLAYPNEKLKLRNIPNDTRWSQQWNMVTVQALRAWELVTGGKNYRGDDVVIAVLDEGFYNDHIDIRDNIWVNQEEVPDDNIDNDGNGYVDDYRGWNFGVSTDDHRKHEHGLGVAGILGASGNNEEGIAGINWQVKIMTLSQSLTTDRLIRAYQYAYEMRRRYNETGGERGAYVVATNFSAGLSNRFGTEAAMKPWCRMYDLMGSAGIISIGATSNSNVNVDEVGDMPTTCESDYFIAVTNSRRGDKLDTETGYGVKHVDLTAPGSDVPSLVPGDKYGIFGGTSAAAPHVAGAVGLMHALQCETSFLQSIESPGLYALKIRKGIMDGAERLDAFRGVVASGGRLDVLEAIREVQLDCPEFMIPSKRGILEIEEFIIVDNNEIYVEFVSPDERDDYGVMIADVTGRVLYREDGIQPQEFGRKEIILPLPELAGGIYFISVYKTSGIFTKKFVVTK